MKLTGIVKWFNRLKGYGFIQRDDDGLEVFAHYSDIEGDGYRNLYEGDKVEFDLADDGRGPKATHIRTKKSYGS